MTARPSLVPSSLVLAAAAFLAGPAAAQSSEAEIRADIEFARGLASEWSFVDLASDVLDDARKKGPSGKLREELGLAECEVYSQGARIEKDDARRNDLFAQALRQYEEFLDRHPTSEFKPAAETGLIETAVNFAKSVDIALETATGEAAEELQQRKIAVLEKAVSRTAPLIDAIVSTPPEERSAAQLRDAASLMYNRGTMLGAIGAAQENGEYFFQQAIKSLEDMVFFFTEGTPPALRAFQAMGDVYLKWGDPVNAYYMYEGVLNQSWPADPATMQELLDRRARERNPILDEEWAQRYLFLEVSMRGLLECLTIQGETEQACLLALHFYNAHQQKGLDWMPAGYDALLACAQVLLDAGGWIGGNQATGEAQWFATEEEMREVVKGRRHQEDAVSFALTLANIVNNENKGNVLQVRAQKLISEIATRPGVQVSIDVLIQAAEGEFYDGNYDEAITSFKRVLAALESRSSAENLEYGARVYNFLANSFRRSDRILEACAAFEAGIEANPDDLDYTELNAKGFRHMAKRLADVAPADEVLKARLAYAEQELLKRVTEGVDRLHFANGEKAAREKRWQEAIDHYRQVKPDSEYGEKARIEIGVCIYRDGDPDAALAIFDDYLGGFVTNPANILDSPRYKQKRSEAIATAEFYRGFIHYGMADQADTPEAWAKVDQDLSGFPERHPQQTKLAPLALRLTMEARLGQGDRAGARKSIDQLVDQFEDSTHTARGSVTFYNTLRDMRKAAAEAGAPEADSLLREMAGFLKIANSIMDTDFTRLRYESLHWIELAESVEAERVLVRLASEFAADPARQSDLTLHVLPDLGEVLLVNGKADQAKAILAPLVMDEGASPSKSTVLAFCRAVSGWLIGGDQGTPVQAVVGVGGSDEEWQKVVDSLQRMIDSSEDKWSCPAYEYRLMNIWAYHTWGLSDSRKADSAQGQLAQFDANFERSDYALIGQACDEQEDETLKARLGAGVLQSRFQFLKTSVR